MNSASICSIHVSYNFHRLIFRTCCCHLKNMTVADRDELFDDVTQSILIRIAKYHSLHFSTPSEFSNVVANCLPESMHNRTGCICEIFHQSEFSYVALNCLPVQMQSRIGCIYEIFHHSEFSNVASNRLPRQMHSRTVCICGIFLQSEFSSVS